MRLSAGTVVTDQRVLSPGWIDIKGTRIVAVGEPGPGESLDFPTATLVPGFVDMHVHGGGGGSFSSYDLSDIEQGIDYHRQQGTTSSVASLVTADLETLRSSIKLLKTLVDRGELIGIHLEGPWLSPQRCGAHDPTLLRHPDPIEVAGLIATGVGTVRMITLAPELPGALESIASIVQVGAIAAIGHTNADYPTTLAAINAGATVATHLFNAMTGIHHREPGPIPALLNDSRVTLELITDAVHLDPAIAQIVEAVAGSDRIALVTDAIAATGMPDGSYALGSVLVEVCCGTAKVAGTETIAGSTATMAALFRGAVVGQPTPETLQRAVRLTAQNPARALGLKDIGRIAPGYSADVLVLDHALNVQAVMRHGKWEREA